MNHAATTPTDSESTLKETIRRQYDDFAGRYDSMLGHRVLERLHLGRCRRRLLAHAEGAVLEVGAGTGLNLEYYPPECGLTAVDLSPAMLRLAQERAEALDRDVAFAVMDAESLDFPDASFDTVTSSLSTCTFPDSIQALREMARVCKPGGRILLLEHGRVSWRWGARLQDRFADWQYRQLSCRWNQDPPDLVERAGLRALHTRRSVLGIFSEIEAQP